VHFYGRDFEKALDAAHRSNVIESRPLRRLNEAIYATYAGDFTAAIHGAEALLTENPDFENAYVALAQARLANGELEAARDAYRRLAERGERGSSLSATGLADIALYEGRLQEAESILAAALAEDLEEHSKFAGAQKLAMLAQIRILQGDADAALADVEQAISLSEDIGTRFWAAMTQLQAGNRERALDLAEAIGAQDDLESKALGNVLKAEAALIDGDPERAIDLLLEARLIADTWLGRLALGRAYLQAERFAEASSELDTCLRRRGEATSLFLDDVPTNRVVPDVLYYLGSSQDGLGSAGAVDSYREFLRVRSGGDDTALTLEAKRRLATPR
jgi:tetratricopeptide (TPR) repeat protein